jgi:hypothetical protein
LGLSGDKVIQILIILLHYLLRQATFLSEAELATGVMSADTKIHHKYSEDVPVAMRFDMGGTQDQRLLMVTMKRLATTQV